VFDSRFLFSIVMVSRWFVRACMVEDVYTSNNAAHLLLYGGAGTGKTLLVSCISSAIATYKFLTESRFQNPDLLKASLLSLEEFKTLDLPSSQYKQLLDLKSHLKIDFKNLNPENVTAGVPCMITTNDDVFTVLRGQKKYN
jgi:DNA replication protein DnaC